MLEHFSFACLFFSCSIYYNVGVDPVVLFFFSYGGAFLFWFLIGTFYHSLRSGTCRGAMVGLSVSLILCDSVMQLRRF